MKFGIDLILLVSFALFVFAGGSLGGVRSVLKMISFFGSTLLALVLFPWAQKTQAYRMFGEWLKTALLRKGVALFSGQAANFLCGILTALILYVSCKLVLFFLSVVLEGAVKLPGLRQANRLSGMLIGAAEGAILILGILAILHLISGACGAMPIYDWIRQSHLTGMLYSCNPLLLFLK